MYHFDLKKLTTLSLLLMLPLLSQGVWIHCDESESHQNTDQPSLKTYASRVEPTEIHIDISCFRCHELLRLVGRYGEGIRANVWVIFEERIIPLNELHILDLEALRNYLQRNSDIPDADYFYSLINREHLRRYTRNRHTETMLQAVEYAPGKRMHLRETYEDLFGKD